MKLNKILLFGAVALGNACCSCRVPVEHTEQLAVQMVSDGKGGQEPQVQLSSLGGSFLEQLVLVQQLADVAQLATPALKRLSAEIEQEKKAVALVLFRQAIEEAQAYVCQRATGTRLTNLVAALGRVHEELTRRFPIKQSIDQKIQLLSSLNSVGPIKPTSANIPNTLVSRDENGNFAAEVITASLVGAASRNVLKSGDGMTGPLTMTAGNGVRFMNASGSAGVTVCAHPAQAAEYTLALPPVQGFAGQVLAQSKNSGQLEWSTLSEGGNQVTPESSLADPNTLVLRDSNGDFAARVITSDLRGMVRGDVVGNLTGTVTGKATENILRTGDTMAGPLTIAAQMPLGFADTEGKVACLQAPQLLNESYTLTLPQARGVAGQVLVQADNGKLRWTSLTSLPQGSPASVALTANSDAIVSADDASNQLYNLTPVCIPLAGDTKSYSYGFLSNSAVAEFPLLVGYDGAGNAATFDAQQLVPLLVNEIKQLQTSHEALWKAITVLQGQINMRGKQL